MLTVCVFRLTSCVLRESPALKRRALFELPSRNYRVIYGDVANLPQTVRNYVEENARLCRPDTLHICDGSERENELLTYMLQKDGILKRLPKYENWLVLHPINIRLTEDVNWIS